MAHRDLVVRDRPVFDQLHPKVYATATGLVIWFAGAAWILFDHSFGGPMVSVLLLIAVLLPFCAVAGVEAVPDAV